MKQSKFKKVAFLSLLLFFCWFTGKSQIPQKGLNIQSPNASSLGLFGEIPVSYFTGVPRVSVPLFNLTEGRISVPISLGYHASGVRPDQHPGWVGLGWSLASGGTITRIVKSKPDEYDVPDSDAKGFDQSYALLNTNDWETAEYLQSVISYDSPDLEPDHFNFDFPGYSGTFYQNTDGQWKVKCDKPLKVTTNKNDLIMPPFGSYPGTRMYQGLQMKAYNGFTITSEDGTQYLFGYTNDAIEYSLPFFDQNTKDWIAGSWNLTKIINPNGQQVTFTYQRGSLINQMGLYKTDTVELRLYHYNGWTNPLCLNGSFNYNIEASYDGSLISPVYLKTIQSDNGTISFYRSKSTELRYTQDVYQYHFDQNNSSEFLPFLSKGTFYQGCVDSLKWDKLDSICVKNSNGVFIKALQFNYNNIATERLTLLGLTEKGSKGETGKSYSFTYDQSNSLPRYLANETDHWGFWNGMQSSFVVGEPSYNYYEVYRQPKAEYLYAGTLKKIFYPNSGATEFIYEPHNYSSQVSLDRSTAPEALSTNQLAGGLRIKKIINYEDISHPEKKVEKEYFYVKSFTNTVDPNTLPSSGVLGGQIQYFFVDYDLPTTSDPNIMFSRQIFSSQSMLPITINNSGSYIGYTNVIEKRNDNSYTKFTFSNFDNGFYDEKAELYLLPNRTFYDVYESLGEERGKLLKSEVFNSSNQIVYKKEYTYSALNKDNEFVKSVSANRRIICSGLPQYNTDECSAYKIYTFSYLPDNEMETVYNPENATSIFTQKQYSYDSNYRLLKSKSIFTSNSKTQTTTYKYPFDMYQGSELLGNYQYMVDKNIVAPIVEESQRVDNIQTKFLRTNFEYFSNNNFLQKTVETQNENYLIDTRFRYHLYDSYDNILTLSKENGAKTSFIYDYHNLYPIAEVKNADFNSIAYTSFEADGNGNWAIPSSLRDTLATAVTGRRSYNLSNGSITKSGLSYGIPYTVSYWSLNGSCMVNGQSPSRAGHSINGWTYYEHTLYTSSQITISGTSLIDELRLYPSTAEMTTTTYTPLKGISSQCDSKNNITYHYYNNFSDLARITDIDKNILKEYTYNYGSNPITNGVYYNTYKSQPFTKQCTGEQGTVVTYHVDAGSYSSTSQDDADQLAQNDINANGQNYANANGSCIPITRTLTIFISSDLTTMQLKFCTVTIRDANSNIVYTKYLNTITYPFTTTLTDSPSYTVTLVPGNTPLEVTVNNVMKDVYSSQTWSQITGNISIDLSASFY
jgi:Family of unknown function (DUF5977)